MLSDEFGAAEPFFGVGGDVAQEYNDHIGSSELALTRPDASCPFPEISASAGMGHGGSDKR